MNKFLIFLRLLLIVTALLLLLDYSVVRTIRRKNPVSVFVVLDSSLSMRLSSRHKDAERAAQRLVSQKSGRIRYRMYTFSDSLRPLKEFSSYRADGDQSSFRETLVKIMEESWTHHPDAVFLISDGADTQNAPYEDVLQSFHESGIPFYAFYAGSEKSFPDVRLLDVQVPAIIKAGEKADILALLSQHGFTGDAGTVRLAARGFKEKQEAIRMQAQETAARFELQASKPGIVVGEISMPPLPGEKGTQNNGKQFSFVVSKDKWDVMFLHESLNWEFSFLKKFLSSHPKLNVKSKWLRPDDSRASSIIQSMRKSDFVVFGDVDCRRIETFRGSLPSFLAVVSGKETCVNKTAVFPFTMLKSGSGEEVYKVSLKSSRLMSVETVQPSLPETLLLSGLLPVKSAGSVTTYIEAADLNGNAYPVYAVSESAVKKQGYFFSSSTWRWAMNKDKKTSEAYSVMWQKIIESYMKTQNPALEIYPERKFYSLNERAKLYAAYSGGEGQSPAFNAELVLPSGKKTPLSFAPENIEGTLFLSEVELKQEGKYSFIVAAKAGSKTLGAKKAFFKVKKFPRDYEYSAGNPEALKRIAKMTGGKFFKAGQSDALKNTMMSMTNIQEEKKTVKITRSPFFLALLLFLFCTDIFIRKRAGLP